MSIIRTSSQYLTVLFDSLYGGNKRQTQSALLIFYMIMVVILFSLGFGAYFVHHDLTYGILACCLGLLTTGIDLILLFVIKRLAFAGHFFCFSTLLFFSYSIYLTEGIVSPYVPWMVMAPVTANLLFGKRATLFWATVTIAELILLTFLHPFGLDSETTHYFLVKDEITLFANAGLFAYTAILVLSAEKVQTDLNRLQRLLSSDETLQKDSLKQAIQGRERERQRIARELHDGLNNTLTVVRLQHQAILQNRAPADPEIARFLQNVDGLSVRVSRMSEDLSAHVLRDFGLSDSIRHLASRFQDRHGIEPEVFFHQGDTVPISLHLPIYRMLQTALNNVVYNNGPTNITLQVLANKSLVRLMIESDGKGYSEEEQIALLLRNRHSPLSETMDQIHLLEGEMVLDSRPGRGLSLIIEIPIAP